MVVAMSSGRSLLTVGVSPGHSQGHELDVVCHAPVAEGVGLDLVALAALAFDGHRGVVGVGDLKLSAALAARAVLRILCGEVAYVALDRAAAVKRCILRCVSAQRQERFWA